MVKREGVEPIRFMGYGTITGKELHDRIASGDPVSLIDVREPAEHEIASIPGSSFRPLSVFDQWESTLSHDGEIVFMCHHGIRSAQVCSYFFGKGFTNIFNLEGGIDRWSCEVDPNIPRY